MKLSCGTLCIFLWAFPPCGQAQERYFVIDGWNNTATSLIATPTARETEHFWDNIHTMLDENPDTLLWDNDFQPFTSTIARAPLPEGPLRPCYAPVQVQTDQQLVIKIVVLNADGTEMALDLPMRMLPEDSLCTWEEKMLLPPGTWRFRVVALLGYVVQEGEILPEG